MRSVALGSFQGRGTFTLAGLDRRVHLVLKREGVEDVAVSAPASVPGSTLLDRLGRVQMAVVLISFRPVGGGTGGSSRLQCRASCSPPPRQKEAPIYEAGIVALLDDLRKRSLSSKMVTVMGALGHTSRCNSNGGPDSGIAATNVQITNGSDRNGQVHGVADAHEGSERCKK